MSQGYDYETAVHTLVSAANHLFASRCPEHYQGFADMSKGDQAAINILDYIARGILRDWRLSGQRAEQG